MIYEIRTYTLRPRTIAEVEKRFGEAYPAREKHSKMAGFFRTEIGPLNEIVHIWPYANIEERNRIRAEAVKDASWPPPIAEFIVNQKVEIVTPFPFAPEWVPGQDGPYYEMRQYTFRPGQLPNIMEAWKAALPERLKFSKSALLGSLEIGPIANSFIHMWPYHSLNDREETRRAAAGSGKWPASVAEPYVQQMNKILVASSFSPAQ